MVRGSGGKSSRAGIRKLPELAMLEREKANSPTKTHAAVEDQNRLSKHKERRGEVQARAWYGEVKEKECRRSKGSEKVNLTAKKKAGPRREKGLGPRGRKAKGSPNGATG